MDRKTSKGKCYLCGKIFGKSAMTRHIKSCLEEKCFEPKGRAELFLLTVRGGPSYWLHILIPSHSTLDNLDAFLRHIWVECCGHLSMFRINGISYTKEPMEEYDDQDMNIQVGQIFYPGLKFQYEYDFGTPTNLTLEVTGSLKNNRKLKKIELVAMNEQPLKKCEVCGKEAVWVCCQCIMDNKGWLCNNCAEDHECGEDMLLPVVNSPRVGMCGYTGC